MKVRLVRPARINFDAGEVVEASPRQAESLIAIGAAVPVAEERPVLKPETPETRKKTTRKG